MDNPLSRLSPPRASDHPTREDVLSAFLSRWHTGRTCPTGLLLLVAAGGALAHEGHRHSAVATTTAEEQFFLAENHASMARMMHAMAVPPNGDIVAMMTAPHQGAIYMATTLLPHGGNEALRRMAQEIIVTQQAEIAAMRMAIDEPLPPSVPAPTCWPSPAPDGQ